MIERNQCERRLKRYSSLMTCCIESVKPRPTLNEEDVMCSLKFCKKKEPNTCMELNTCTVTLTVARKFRSAQDPTFDTYQQLAGSSSKMRDSDRHNQNPDCDNRSHPRGTCTIPP